MNAWQEYRRVLFLHIRMQFSLSALGAKGRKRSGRETAKLLGFGFLLLYAVGAVLLFYGLILFPFLRGAAEMGLQVPVMGIVILLCMIIVMFFGTMSLFSLVFGARDAETYAALPLREQTVFAVKFTMTYGIEAATTAVFLWPAVVIYGVVSELPAPSFLLLILRALPVWLLLPAVPMALAALLSMLLTRLTALSRHRDALMLVFGMVLVLGMTLGQGLLSGRLATALGDADKVTEMLTDTGAMLKAVTRAFPPAMWGAQALIGAAAETALGYFGLAAAAAAGAAVCLPLSRRLYYKGVLAQLEAPRSKKKGYKQGGVKAGGALGAFYSKEMRTIFRTPVYALNILTGIVILPLMLAVGLIGTGGLSAGAGELKDLLNSLLGGSSGDMFYLLAAGVVMLTGVMGSTGVSTSFSREGRMLWLSQTVPVPARTQVAARLLAGFTLSLGGAVLSLAVLSILAGFTPAQAVFGLVAGSCAAFPLLAAAIIPDALKPKRKWNSEAEAMKQNFNSILGLLLDIGIAVVIGFAAYALQKLLPVWAAAAILAPACLGGGYAVFCCAARIADKMMKTADG
ncbi:MAG: hypothetical protein LBH95_09760 [Oscillospiraceae bacterium]|jgi:ABC-2 type transport system permease protein|nr:hypothetical protein [Oscillospiraceae bacterium]